VSAPDVAEKLTSLAKRRGFVFPSSEIYGGAGATWDYGPLGVELKNNVKRSWWRAMVQLREDVVGLDAAILMHPRVWEASGHVENFIDPLVECRNCRKRFRIDELPDGARLMDAWRSGTADLTSTPCPNCGEKKLADPRRFNLMFKTFVGPVEETAAVAWLRPETAQGIFVNFENVQQSTRRRLPFGIAQIGKSFRNEITPGNFIFRSREFEQMEIEFFVNPHDRLEGRPADEAWHDRWIADCQAWFTRYGLDPANVKLHEHLGDELAHYSKRTVDLLYRFPMGWNELMGIANRTDFDLKQHAKFSGKSLTWFDEERKEHVVPFVIEPSAGVDRALLAFLLDAYREEEVRGEKRVVLRFHPELAPIKIAVLPLLKKRPEIVAAGHDLRHRLTRRWLTLYDDTAAIGRLYRRQDEVGTPYCVTVDVKTVGDPEKGEAGDGKVTIRERDTMQQIRVPIAELEHVFGRLLDAGTPWSEVAAGYPRAEG